MYTNCFYACYYYYYFCTKDQDNSKVQVNNKQSTNIENTLKINI